MADLKWRRYCSDCQANVHVVQDESLGEPSGCPNNAAHTLDPEDKWVAIEPD
jgi:hypothetical protein